VADHHGVAAAAYDVLRHLPDAPAELVDALKDRHTEALRHHLRIVWELARVRPALEATNSRWAVLKGPVLAELVYDAPGQRFYGDLDLLVERSSFRQVLDNLVDSGSRLLDRNWRLMRREMHGEVHLELPAGSLLDLHWDLVNLYRGQLRIDAAAMLERAETVDLGGIRVPTLEPTDSLIHLALHGTMSGGDRLRWIHDVAQAIRRRPPNWDELMARAEAWRATAPVGLLLSRARGVLGADVPPEIPRRLLGWRYSALVRLADRIAPWQRANGRLTSPSLAIARSMGYGLPGAGAWLVRRAIKRLDPREPRASSTFAPGGDEADYEAYLESVIRVATSR